MGKGVTVKTVIGNLLFISILLLILTRFLSAWSGVAFPVNLISAGSMYPTLMEGDIVAWVPTDVNNIRVGDIIVYKSWLHWPDERFVVHRVVEVKSIWGKPAFVTKGDANNYTDQAGPHVVEPYVTEKNLVGKVLSVGQMPLKIPLVGLLGIWVNDGFQRLAQPSASKGSLTYIGVFTPLVIAIVIFIIALFILPERSRDLKDKLKMYILGGEALSVKKAVLFFFVVYLALIVLVHCFAYDSTSASLGVGEFPDKSGFELGSVSPGSRTTPRSIPVFNPSILPVKGVVIGGGGLSSFVNRAVFTLNPGESKQVSVTAEAGSSVSPGTYKGSVMFYSSPLYFLLPDELLLKLDTGYTELTIICLDVITAVILTGVTIFLIVSIEFLFKCYTWWSVDRSWCHAKKFFLKKGVVDVAHRFKLRLSRFFIERISWVFGLNLSGLDWRKPFYASLIVIPLLLFLNDDFLATFIAAVFSGIVAYGISCKQRVRVITASLLSFGIGVLYCLIRAVYYVFSTGQSFLNSLTLSVGAVALYLVVLSLLLIPLSLFSWLFTRCIRNLKEQRDPLLVLEGRCDL
jgi:signal peptidase I